MNPARSVLARSFSPQRSPVLWLLTAALTACGGGTPAPGSNTAPEISIKTAAGTAITPDTYVGSGGQLLVTTSDLEGSVKKVVYSIDGGPDTELTPASRITLTLPALTGGAHTVKVVATDDAGLATTVNVPFLIDNAAPVLNSVTLNGTAAATATTFTVGDAATLVARASDTRGDAASTPASVIVQILENGTVRATGTGSVSADLSKNADGTPRTAGTVTVTIQAIDSVGFGISRTVNLTFLAASAGEGGGTATTPPTLTWLTPAADFVSGNGSVNLRATAARNGQDVTGSLTYSATCGTVVGNIWTLGNDCADGSKQVLTATVTDGGKQYSLSKTVTVDSSNPSVQLTSPQQGQSVTTNPVTVKVNATDSGSGVEKIDVSATDANGVVTRVGSLQGAAGDVIWAPMNGTYTLTATATDKVGRTSLSTVTGVRVQLSSTDATDPTVTAVTLPTGTLRGTQTVTVDATDAAPTSGIAKVELLDGSTSLGAQSAGVNGRYTFSLDTTKLSDGAHTLRAVVTDNVGRSGEKTATVTVDNTAPIVTWQSPAAGSVTKGRVTLNATSNEGALSYLVDGNAATDVDAAVAGVQVDLVDGPRQLTAVASDAAGNKTSVAISVTADSTSPTVQITSPTANQNFTAAPISVAVQAQDIGSGIASIAVYARSAAGTEEFVGTLTASGSLPWYPQKTDSTAYELRAEVTDKAGNTSLSTLVSGVKLQTGSAITPQAVTVSVPAAAPQGKTVNQSGRDYVRGYLNVKASATTNAVSGLKSAELLVGNAVVATETQSAGNPTFNFNFDTLNDGLHDVAVRFTDNVGTVNAPKISVFVDKTAPIVAWSTPLNGLVTNNATPILTATATDAVFGTLTPTYTVDGGPAPAALSEGPHVLVATGTDPLGNTNQSSISITVDQSAPDMNVTSPTAGQEFTAAPITISGTATDRLSSVVSINATVTNPDGTTTVLGQQAGGNYSAPFTPSTPGTYSVQFTATDAAGNTSSTISRTFTLRATQEASAPAPVIIVNNTGSQPYSSILSVNVSAGVSAGVTVRQLILEVTDSKGIVDTTTYTANRENTTFNIDTTKFPDGALTLRAIAIDSNNQRGQSTATTVQVANKVAPTISITSPTTGGSVSGPSEVVVQIRQNNTAFNFVTNSIVIEVIDSRGQLVTTRDVTIEPVNPGLWQARTTVDFNATEYVNGNYTIRAKTNVQLSGEATLRELSTANTVSNLSKVDLSPALNIILPAFYGNPIDPLKRPVLTRKSAVAIQVSDSDSINQVQLQFVCNPTEALVGQVCNTVAYNFNLPIGAAGLFYRVFNTGVLIDSQPFVPDGNYVMRATATDAAGNSNIKEMRVEVRRSAAGIANLGSLLTTTEESASSKFTPASATWALSGTTLNDTRVLRLEYSSIGQGLGTEIPTLTSINTQLAKNSTISNKVIFGEAGTFRQSYLVQDLETGVVEFYEGRTVNVTTKEGATSK
ncbi:S-layer family protein [Deinococcus sp. QL22]|uniref:beta strand repeat-containing protein n=1 Tax=Deinococcus sp. QL22 TaxID=2939437 RepID=UPI002017653F|nr:Ig-like domain-containing protein [Deinococcus sp. QL22]UQN06601.1 Ig-like domain-containing protein [Deinococcus sp. QL22]